MTDNKVSLFFLLVVC